MKKDLREVEALVELVNEYAQIKNNIAALPCGYISVKQISGHTYCYRQWREGRQIISEYVPEAKLASVKRKIGSRKDQEALLKEVKKELKKVSRKVVKSGLLSDEDISVLLDSAVNGEDAAVKAEELMKK